MNFSSATSSSSLRMSELVLERISSLLHSLIILILDSTSSSRVAPLSLAPRVITSTYSLFLFDLLGLASLIKLAHLLRPLQFLGLDLPSLPDRLKMQVKVRRQSLIHIPFTLQLRVNLCHKLVSQHI